MQNDKEKLPKESAKSESKQPKITKESVEKLSDEELDKVAGGAGFPCPNPTCIFTGNRCVCPGSDEDKNSQKPEIFR